MFSNGKQSSCFLGRQVTEKTGEWREQLELPGKSCEMLRNNKVQEARGFSSRRSRRLQSDKDKGQRARQFVGRETGERPRPAGLGRVFLDIYSRLIAIGSALAKIEKYNSALGNV